METLAAEKFRALNPSILAKLGRFASAGAGAVRYVFDFDGTVTSGSNSWRVVSDLSSPAGRASMEARRKYYLAKEAACGLTIGDSLAWSAADFDHCTEQRLPKAALMEGGRKLPERDGAGHLLSELALLGIRTEFITAGVEPVVAAWLGRCVQGGLPDVIATSVAYSDGRVCGWDKKTLVHPRNKSGIGATLYEQASSQYPYTIVIGDSPYDISMAPSGDNTIGVLVCNPGDRGLDSHIASGKEAGFDLAVIGSLEPLTAVTRQLYNPDGEIILPN